MKSISSAASKEMAKDTEGWGGISHIWLYLMCCFLRGEPHKSLLQQAFLRRGGSANLLSPRALQSFLLRPQRREQGPCLTAVL